MCKSCDSHQITMWCPYTCSIAPKNRHEVMFHGELNWGIVYFSHAACMCGPCDVHVTSMWKSSNSHVIVIDIEMKSCSMWNWIGVCSLYVHVWSIWCSYHNKRNVCAPSSSWRRESRYNLRQNTIPGWETKRMEMKHMLELPCINHICRVVRLLNLDTVHLRAQCCSCANSLWRGVGKVKP